MSKRRRLAAGVTAIAVGFVFSGTMRVGAGPVEVANAVLSRDPHKPANVNLFTSNFDTGRRGAYPEATPMPRAGGPDASTSETRAQLDRHMHEQFPTTTPDIDRAMALYDSPAVVARISNPALRAAFAALTGTIWEPTIAHFLDGGLMTTVTFGQTASPNSIAESVGNVGGTRRVVFNTRYEHEKFPLLIFVMGHEFSHDDTPNSPAEEAHLEAISAMVHAQVLSKHPALAYGTTELARRGNTFVLAFLNSREAGSPNSEIVAPTGRGVYPAGQFAAPDFWTLLSGADSSPAPEVLRIILRNILTPGTTIPATLRFEKATAELFANLGDGWLTDAQRVQISVLLQMVTVDEIAQSSGLGAPQVIDTLGLQPYLDVIGRAGSLAKLTSVQPARLLESRSGAGLATVDGLFLGAGPVAAGNTVEVQVGGRGGVAGDAVAVMLNVTAVNPSAAGFLTVFPCGQTRPNASNVNYTAGAVVPNAVLARIGHQGMVCVFSLATTDLVIDVNGYVPI